MKKMLCAALLLLLLSACGGKTAEPEPVLTVGGTEIDAASTSVEAALAVLGEDYEYAEAVSCVYDGMDKTYSYADATLYTCPDETGDRLMELYCTGGDVKTPAGIALGDGREKVVKTYGGGFVESGAILAYEKEPSAPENEPASLYFELTDGKVTAIAVTSEHRAE